MQPLPGPLAPDYAALAAAAAVLATAVGLVAVRHRSTPGAAWLAVVLLVDAVVAAFAVGGDAVPRTPQVALAVGGLGLVAAVPYVAFVVAYTGRGRHLTYWSLLGYGGPLLVAAALFATTQYHGLMLTGSVGVHRAAGLTLLEFDALAPLLGATLLYVALLLLGTLLLVLQTVVRHERLYLGQSAVLLVAGLAPVAAALPSVGLGRSARGTGPLTVAVATGLMVAVALAVAAAAVRYRLFDFVPAVRQLGDRAAIDDLDDGVLIVDGGDNVVKLNGAAAAILDATGGDVVGTPAAALLGRVGVEELSATPTTFERDGRTYEVTASPITDERDRPIGRTFVLRDVTRRERRKQRLQVLNRVLRHNVRNDMSVVRTNAEIVAEEGGERLAPLGEKMVAIADELVEAGEDVRRIEQLLSVEELSAHTVDLEALLSSVVDDVVVAADHRTVDASVAVGDDVHDVVVNRELLALAVENVIENAVEHNDATVPTVAVTADRAVDGVRITVADDGPGIPDQELGALEAGRETDLQHASSLGLWLVLWSVGRLGGDLTIEHLEPTGTAVSVRLPPAASQIADAGEGADASDVTGEAAEAPAAGDAGRRPAATGEASPGSEAADATPASRAGAGTERVDPTAVSMVADGVAADGPGEETSTTATGSGDGSVSRGPGDGAAEGPTGSTSAGSTADADAADPAGRRGGSTAGRSGSAPGSELDPRMGTPESAGGGTDSGPPRPPSSASASRSDDGRGRDEEGAESSADGTVAGTSTGGDRDDRDAVEEADADGR